MKKIYPFFVQTILLLTLVFFSKKAEAQSHQLVLHPLGALPIPDSVYKSLPKVNWDTLRKYAPNLPDTSKGIKPLSVNGITMLNNPPVGNQGSEGSCVGWAVGYTAMGILMYNKYSCWNTAERSPADLYNQIKVPGDCTAGSYVTTGLSKVQSSGVCSLILFPYVDGQCNTQPTTSQNADAANNKSTGYGTLTTTDYVSMQNALDLGYPIVISLNIYHSFDVMWNAGEPGIWNSNTGAIRGSHATAIIGYDNSRQMFKAQNQWGTGAYAGDNGFFWIPYTFIQSGCLTGAYVLYGASQPTPMYVNGASNFCTGSRTYTVTNLQAGSSAAWSVDNTSIASVVNSGNSGIVTRIADGTIVVTASVMACDATNSVPITEPVQLGSYNNLSGTYTNTSTYPLYTFNSVPVGSENGNYTWPSVSSPSIAYSGSGTWSYGTSNSFAFSLASGQNMNLYFSGTGTCGTVTATRTFVQQSGGYAIIASPNPSSGSVNLVVSDVIDTSQINAGAMVQSSVTKFSVYDVNSGALVKQWTYNENTGKNYTFDIRGLGAGVYVFKMERNGKTATTKVIKK